MNEQGTALAVAQEPRPATLATWTPTFALGVHEMKARVQAKRDFFDAVMRKDEHYGLPPGMERKTEGPKPKPALLKSGAELLLSSMGLFAELIDAEPPIRDYDGSAHGGEAIIAYRRICRIYRQTGPSEHERVRVVQAEGFCSSRETKYRYRDGSRKCPSCNASAIIVGKAEYGGGFVCFGRKGGCGAKFAADDQSIVGQQAGRIPNPDVADLENTLLKMADKRAYVAATLLATGCSDIFTQDIEEDFDSHDGTVNGASQQRQAQGNGTQEKRGNGGRSGNAQAPSIFDRQKKDIEQRWASMEEEERRALVSLVSARRTDKLDELTADEAGRLQREIAQRGNGKPATSNGAERSAPQGQLNTSGQDCPACGAASGAAHRHECELGAESAAA